MKIPTFPEQLGPPTTLPTLSEAPPLHMLLSQRRKQPPVPHPCWGDSTLPFLPVFKIPKHPSLIPHQGSPLGPQARGLAGKPVILLSCLLNPFFFLLITTLNLHFKSPSSLEAIAMASGSFSQISLSLTKPSSSLPQSQPFKNCCTTLLPQNRP